MTVHLQKRIKLLFLLQTLRTGGSERIVKELCDNLDPNKFRCFVLALVGGEMQEEFREGGIPVHCVNKQGRDILRVSRQISEFIKTNQIQVINAHHFSPFFHGFYGAKLNGCKIIYTAHTCPEVDLLSSSWTMVGRILLSFSDAAIGISHDVSGSIIRKFHLPKDKVFTIINAVDHRRFKVNVDVIDKKKELNIKREEKVIGSIGSLGKQKNYPNLIRAFTILQERMGNIKLLIIGEGRRRNELESLIKELGVDGKVILLGARSDVPELMKVMDVYCLASIYEGLPLSLLEAMVAKLPVIGTDVTGIRDTIIHEKTGLLVTSDAPEELAEGLSRILINPDLAKELSENGQKYALEKHGLAEWIREYEQLFTL